MARYILDLNPIICRVTAFIYHKIPPKQRTLILKCGGCQKLRETHRTVEEIWDLKATIMKNLLLNQNHKMNSIILFATPLVQEIET